MGEVVSLDEYSFRARRPSGRPGGKPPPMDVFFDRRELRMILDVYGHMVSNGDWRDYAIGHDRDNCVFAVFRRGARTPLYRIIKRRPPARRQGHYQVLGLDGHVRRRGPDLQSVLGVFRARRWKIIT